MIFQLFYDCNIFAIINIDLDLKIRSLKLHRQAVPNYEIVASYCDHRCERQTARDEL